MTEGVKSIPQAYFASHYDFPLANWCRACLQTERYRKIVLNIRENRPIDDLVGNPEGTAQVQRLLTSVVTKQFANPNTPIGEIIKNGIDSNETHNGSTERYSVNVKTGTSGVTITETGKGMGLSDILTLLAIPFNTDKSDGGEPVGDYIGQFGIGFFSSLNYCLQAPYINEVIVKTAKSVDNMIESYQARFYALTDNPNSLRMEISKTVYKGRGTYVRIKKPCNTTLLDNFIRTEFKNIPSYRAEIRLNGTVINYDNTKWFGSGSGKMKVGLQAIAEQKIFLTSLGATVKSFDSPATIGLKMQLPRAVPLVIGRDEFVKDKNYLECSKNAFNAFYELVDETLLSDPNHLHDFIELLPAMSAALSIPYGQIPNIYKLNNKLLSHKKFAVLKDEYNNLTGFIGTNSIQQVFYASSQGINFWTMQQQDYQQLLETFQDKYHINLESPSPVLTGPYRNLRILLGQIQNGKYKNPVAKEARIIETEPGKNPFMFDPRSKILYINGLHPHVYDDSEQGIKGDIIKLMSLISKYLRMPQIKSQFEGVPDYIEREMWEIERLLRSGA